MSTGTGKEGVIPQTILPLIPEGATQINDVVSVHCGAECWTYFLGAFAIGKHAASDRRMFQVITSQLIDSGSCRQAEIIRSFGVAKSNVARALRRYRAGGVEAFFEPRRARRGGTVLSSEVVEAAQGLLDQGYRRNEVAEELGVKRDTLRKAIAEGRLYERPVRTGADKSARSVEDAAVGELMGTACTRISERVLAAVGKLPGGAPVRFEACRDVPYGGVLCALPALILNGLIEGADRYLHDLGGYYRAVHVLLLMGFMALCRIKTVEQLRGEAPGEFGKLLGLDRIPEVRCLRGKLSELGREGAADRWAAHLSQRWMEAEPEATGTLYVDGHVRVYHGSKTTPPRRYVSRQRLCLRGISDYWVNDGLGRPFFVVEKTVDPGLLEVLRSDIVPRLLREVPAQPSEEELEKDPYLSRLVLVFDREGYSPEFFGEMWQQHRIGCITYHKHPRGQWPEHCFSDQTFTLPGGETLTMALAEMGSRVGSGKSAMWMREVRKLTESGHQVSLISTAFGVAHTELAARLFTRWCQENFLRYMMQHFALDLLGEYATAPLPDTQRVVNPTWRELAKRRNSVRGKLTHRYAKFTTLTLHLEPQTDKSRLRKWLQKKAKLLEEIQQDEKEIEELTATLKGTEHYIRSDQLPEEHKFHSLAPTRRRLLDTIRMIAYRAETAMVPLLLDEHTDSPAARTILQDLFRSPADVLPEPDQQCLRVCVHRAARPATDRRLEQLFAVLNEAQLTYPGSDLVVRYELLAKPDRQPHNGVNATSAR